MKWVMVLYLYEHDTNKYLRLRELQVAQFSMRKFIILHQLMLTMNVNVHLLVEKQKIHLN